MKASVLPLIFLFLISCSDTSSSTREEDALKGKLPATLVNNPRTMEGDATNALEKLGRLQFADTIHHFGKLREGEVVEYEFTFTNGGGSDIIINEAKGSCGCTVPEFPNRPIKPGEGDKIKVTFNSEGKPGINEKSVLVTTNGNPAIYNLIIQAEVAHR